MSECPRCFGGGKVAGVMWMVPCPVCGDDSKLPVESDVIAFLEREDLGALVSWRLLPYSGGWRVEIWTSREDWVWVVASGNLFPKPVRFRSVL